MLISVFPALMIRPSSDHKALKDMMLSSLFLGGNQSKDSKTMTAILAMQIRFWELFSPFKLSNILTQKPHLCMCGPDKYPILLKAICRNTFKCNHLNSVGSFNA